MWNPCARPCCELERNRRSQECFKRNRQFSAESTPVKSVHSTCLIHSLRSTQSRIRIQKLVETNKYFHAFSRIGFTLSTLHEIKLIRINSPSPRALGEPGTRLRHLLFIVMPSGDTPSGRLIRSHFRFWLFLCGNLASARTDSKTDGRSCFGPFSFGDERGKIVSPSSVLRAMLGSGGGFRTDCFTNRSFQAGDSEQSLLR